MSELPRPDGRISDQLRDVSFEPNFAPNATGSVLVSFGNTKVICAASIEKKVPRWMQAQKVEGGWISAEYSMLPYSTLDRKQRDISKGKMDGRSVEIQRLIGRSLRAVIDLSKLPGYTIWVDCDVLQADGGTRTAAITGAYVAVHRAIQRLMDDGVLPENPIKDSIAAISVGIYYDTAVLDLNYTEDVAASVDFNVVMTGKGRFVELQGTGEEASFSEEELAQLIDLAKKGIHELTQKQHAFLEKPA